MFVALFTCGLAMFNFQGPITLVT